ncbi:hypothetical protein PAMA_001914 [Pampus argenteus]
MFILEFIEKGNTNMLTKTSRGDKGATRLPTEAAASLDQASTPHQAEEEDELPFIWQKMSDKFELSFQNLLSAQRALTERLFVNENQNADHEQCILAVETSLAMLQQESKKLQHKDCKYCISESEKRRQTEFVSNLIPKLLGDDIYTKPVVIDQTHRTVDPQSYTGPALQLKGPKSIATEYYSDRTNQLI